MRKKIYFIEFIAAAALGLILYCLNIVIVANNTTYKYAIELWNYGREYLNILYPLIITLPFCWFLYYEKNSGFWKNIFNRFILNKYIKSRLVIMILLSSLSMFIISFGSFIFACFIAPMNRIMDFEPIMTDVFLGSYQMEKPFLYAFLISVWRTVLAALYTALGFGLTMTVKNIFIALSGTFIFSILENFITAILQVPELSICTSFYPNRLSGDSVTPVKMLAGPMLLLIIILMIYVYYDKKEKGALLD